MPDPVAFIPAGSGIQEASLVVETKPGRQNPLAYARAVVLSLAQIVGDKTSAIAVDANHPIPTASRGYRTSTAVVVGTNGTPGRAVHVTCTVAGDVKLRLTDDSEIVLTVEVGGSVLPFEAKTVVVAGTTATATYRNLA